MNKIWQEHEKKFIRDNAGILKDSELAAKLTKITGRQVSLQAVRKQRQKMGITKEPGRGRCKVVGQEEKRPPFDPTDVVAGPASPETDKLAHKLLKDKT